MDGVAGAAEKAAVVQNQNVTPHLAEVVIVCNLKAADIRCLNF